MTRCGVLAAFVFCFFVITNGCSNVVGPDPEDVISITYSVSGFAAQQMLTVSRNTVRCQSGGQAKRYQYDTVMNDSAFLDALLRAVNLTHAFNESDDVDKGDLADDGALFTVEFIYHVHPGSETTATKQIQFTGGPPDSIRDIVRSLEDRTRQMGFK